MIFFFNVRLDNGFLNSLSTFGTIALKNTILSEKGRESQLIMFIYFIKMQKYNFLN